MRISCPKNISGKSGLQIVKFLKLYNPFMTTNNKYNSGNSGDLKLFQALINRVKAIKNKILLIAVKPIIAKCIH